MTLGLISELSVPMIVFPHMLFIIVLEVFYGDEVILSYVFQLKSEIAKHLI